MNSIGLSRLIFVLLIFFGCYTLSLVNLFRLQVGQNNFFRERAQRQYNVSITQTPPRALIYDRNGCPLALNRESFSAFITPNNLEHPNDVIKFLKQHFPQAHTRLMHHNDDLFMYIKRRLSPEDILLITAANLPDINLLQEPNRLYTVPSLGHTIGVTDIDNRGISGIELICDERVAGKPTTYTLEKDARSRHFYFKKDTAVQGYEGTPVKLTIDADLQFLAYEELKDHVTALGAQEGAVLIMNATEGDVLAMACVPDFDPNDPLDDNLWKTKNRIITECYEFGSVMKLFPALAALSEGVVQPDEMIDCENRKETFINGMKVTTWKECGLLSYTEVIRNSNNIGTSKVALRLGKPLYEHYRKAGFTAPTGINFIGEQLGFITPPRQWSKATPLSLSFGYEVSATLLQLARGFSLLANKGALVHPRLLIEPQLEKRHAKKQVYTPEIIDIMRSAINLDNESSTGWHGRIEGYSIMGKTGSAYLITDGTYDKTRSIYSFAGLLEKDDYKRIIVVFIREPQPTGKKVYAATVAVPLFKRIAQAMVIHDNVV